MSKLVSKDEFINIRKNLKSLNKKIVLCHGVFDLVHPGHIIHFKNAKSMGDILVVSITSYEFVRKGPDRPYFNNNLRIEFLSSIEFIDYVILSEEFTAKDIIESVCPDIYVKGEEYKNHDKDITSEISNEVDLVEKFGGVVKYTDGQVFSSTKIINNMFNAISNEVKEYIKDFKSRNTMEDILKYVEKMKNLKVLVLGEVIIDQYIFCKLNGIMSKDIGYSASYLKDEKYLGGSFVIAKDISDFSDNVTLLSLMGDEESLKTRVNQESSKSLNLNIKFSKNYETIVKTKYVTENKEREELNKIFAINNLKEKSIINIEDLNWIKNFLMEEIKKYDLVVVCDFGHGLITSEMIEILTKEANCISVNCQANSSNFGKNLITKYKDIDSFTLDRREINLAMPNYIEDEEKALKALSEILKSEGFLTLGARGGLSISKGVIKKCPTFNLKVKDAIGAGDAFFAISSLCKGIDAPAEVGLFLGSISAALATKICGNKYKIEKVNLIKYCSTLLNI